MQIKVSSKLSNIQFIQIVRILIYPMYFEIFEDYEWSMLKIAKSFS